jgi:hypothetical protein
VIYFTCGLGRGGCSADEIEKYFEKVESEKEMLAFNNGDVVEMVKTENWLAPMEVGDTYRIHDTKYGVITLYSEKTEKYYGVSNEVLQKYFKKVVKVDKIEEAVDYIDTLLENSQLNISKVFDKCTVVACKLPNGFVIVESSSCVNPNDYNEDIGVSNCLNRIKGRIAEMEAYASHEDMTYGCDCECGCDCNDCPFEDDDDCYYDEDDEDCTQNDLDCDDCPNKNDCGYYNAD